MYLASPTAGTRQLNEGQRWRGHCDERCGTSDGEKGSTECVINPRTGLPTARVHREIKDTHPCTRPCVVQHENVHVRALRPVCRRVHRCLQRAGADQRKQDECLDAYEAESWELVPRTECKAYAVEARCLAKRQRKRACGGSGGRKQWESKVGTVKCYRDCFCQPTPPSHAGVQDSRFRARFSRSPMVTASLSRSSVLPVRQRGMAQGPLGEPFGAPTLRRFAPSELVLTPEQALKVLLFFWPGTDVSLLGVVADSDREFAQGLLLEGLRASKDMDLVKRTFNRWFGGVARAYRSIWATAVRLAHIATRNRWLPQVFAGIDPKKVILYESVRKNLARNFRSVWKLRIETGQLIY